MQDIDFDELYSFVKVLTCVIVVRRFKNIKNREWMVSRTVFYLVCSFKVSNNFTIKLTNCYEICNIYLSQYRVND